MSPSPRFVHRFAMPADPSPGAQYLPLASLVLPVVGAQIHGSVSDWQDVLMLVLVLHHLLQVIKLPSSLLRLSTPPSSLPRTANADGDPSSEQRVQQSLRFQLRIIHTLALVALLGSPFIAVALLNILQLATTQRTTRKTMEPFISRLSFVAVGLRPLGHLLGLLSRYLYSSPPSHCLDTQNSLSPPFNNQAQSLLEQIRLKSAKIQVAIAEMDTNRSAPANYLDTLASSTSEPVREFKTRLESLLDSHSQVAEHLELTAQMTTNLRSVEQAVKKLTHSITEQERQSQLDASTSTAMLVDHTNRLLLRTGLTFQKIGEILVPSATTDRC